MRGLRKPKRVTWASDLDLCQVRLFLSDESPLQVGLNSQDHLQAGASYDDVLPPGFEGTHTSSQFDIKPAQIPLIKWINPPKIVIDISWQVVAGEESKEVEDQHQREMRVLEAIYPRPSSIPPNPSILMDVEVSDCIDSQITSIPITPIEDEDAATDVLADSMTSLDSLEPPSGIPTAPNSNPSVLFARSAVSDVSGASVVLTNIMKSNEHENLVDHELLNNILNNPEVIEKLVRDYGATNNSGNVHNVGSSSVGFSQPSISVNQGETGVPRPVAFSANSSYPLPSGSGQVRPASTQWRHKPALSGAIVSSPAEVSASKDVNYYKNLIQQHGEQRQETHSYSSNRQIQPSAISHETTHHSRSRESKPKIMKPCIFFNSSKGCRNGANCAYQHDATFQSRGSGIQSSKRMKMDREISS